MTPESSPKHLPDMSIYLPREPENRRALLELLDANSHCLRGARWLEVHYDAELEGDLAELIHKLARVAGVGKTVLIRD